MILLSHPTADHSARHVALALSRAGVLGEFWTCSSNGNAPQPCLLEPPAWTGSSSNAARRASLESICRSLDRTVSSRLACGEFKGIYAYADSADESFRIAGRRGMLRIYDLVAGHWQAEHDLCAEEAALEPEWAATLDCTLNAANSASRKNSELQQADLVMVSSTFMMRTLEQVTPLPGTIALLPPCAASRTEPTSAPTFPAPSSGKLRVLYVGELSQRRGLSYVFRACRELRNFVSLTVIAAHPKVSCPALERELQDVRWRAECSADEIHAEMAAHDVLLAPSLFGGSDSVLLDAMAAGLPIIATPHTAAPDLIDHGLEGFIVPIRSTEEIVAKLEALRREPEWLAEMSANARRRAQRHTWEGYERALAASVATALSRH